MILELEKIKYIGEPSLSKKGPIQVEESTSIAQVGDLAEFITVLKKLDTQDVYSWLQDWALGENLQSKNIDTTLRALLSLDAIEHFSFALLSGPRAIMARDKMNREFLQRYTIFNVLKDVVKPYLPEKPAELPISVRIPQVGVALDEIEKEKAAEAEKVNAGKHVAERVEENVLELATN